MCLTTDQLRAWGTTLAALIALAGAQEPDAGPELQETLLDHWRWVRFDADDGLPDGHVDLLVESRGGVPRASTPLGVARFDGYRWRTVPGLPARRAHAIAAGVGEELWILFPNTLQLVDGATGALRAAYDLEALDPGVSLITMRDTVRVLGTAQGRLVLYDPRDGSMLPVPASASLEYSDS